MKILNSKGEPITLSSLEQRRVDFNQRFCNALGVEINVTTLTTISKKVVDQKFFEVSPSAYFSVAVGQGAWGTSIETYRSYDNSDDFETGVINIGQSAKLASADATVDSVNVKIRNWAKESVWNIFEIEQASKSGNWDVVSAKLRARKRNWDLGIQRIAFLGHRTDTAVKGLLTQTGVTINTTLITQSISSMTTAQLKTFVAGVLGAYRANASFTAMPSHLVMPETDFLGIAAPSNADFPLKSVKQVLEETFQTMTGNPDFKILPLAYADAVNSGLGVQRYALYNGKDSESIRMDIPVDFNATVANSINGFTFQNVAYGQFSGAFAYRPKEMLYFQF